MPQLHREESPFAPGLSGLKFPAARLRIEHQFEPLRADPCLSAHQVQSLERLASWKEHFPAALEVPGRSLYAYLRADSGWPVKGIKMKGAGGMMEMGVGGELLCCPPMPMRQYRGSEPHFALNEQLELRVVMGKPKALNSLRLDAAQNQYDCQQKLADVDLGMRSLVVGRLRENATGNPQVDCWGQQTGAVFEETDASFRLLGDFVKFCLADERSGTRVLLSEAVHMTEEPKIPARFIANYLDFMRRTGVAKRRAALEAAVGRHAAHYDNFLYNAASDKLFIADTDSCKLYEQLAPNLRGPQLLRDVASDLCRVIENLSYFAWSKEFLAGLEARTFQPFESFLSGFFHGHANASEISEHADRLRGRYLAKVETNRERLHWMASAVRNAVASGFFPVPEVQMKSNWFVAHVPFFSDCLETAHSLLTQSTFPEQGFTLPRVRPEILRDQFKRGVNEFLRTIDAPRVYRVPLLR